jgi:hypothetical protein
MMAVMFIFKMVLLGFVDEPKGGKTSNDDDPSNWTISRIGGQPVSINHKIFMLSKLIIKSRHFPVMKFQHN